MKRNLERNKKLSKTDLKKQWEKVWASLEESNNLQGTIFPALLFSHQRIKIQPFNKAFDSLKSNCEKFYDDLELFIEQTDKVDPVEIKLPWTSSKFAKAWQNWKEYLLEQHNINISSRTEEKQLQNLFKISDGKEDNAYPMIDYSIASFYRTLFKLDAKENKTNEEKPANKKEDDY